jgi:hypothetical protein
LVRGLDGARQRGFRTALCDFQTVSATQLESATHLYRSIAHRLAKDLGVGDGWQATWNDFLGPNDNLEEAVETILSQVDGPILWGMDEADRLFGHSYSDDLFGLLRGWYNIRSLEPYGVWSRLTILITYATEAHLFIGDLNQSPFNIGIRLEPKDFSLAQVQVLNDRYGAALKEAIDVEHFFDLTGGHPFLCRKGLDWLASKGGSIFELEEVATQDKGPFGDHLRRLAVVLRTDPLLSEEVRKLLQGLPVSESATYRLVSGGVLVRGHQTRFRSPVYRQYLSETLS